MREQLRVDLVGARRDGDRPDLAEIRLAIARAVGQLRLRSEISMVPTGSDERMRTGMRAASSLNQMTAWPPWLKRPLLLMIGRTATVLKRPAGTLMFCRCSTRMLTGLRSGMK